jgi:hypothetical protein
VARLQGHLLIDANVVIDYQVADLSVLSLAARHLGEIHVLSTVLEEVDGLTDTDCALIGLQVLEPELAELTEAAGRRGGLSAQDRLCLIVARERGWTCVTNDAVLRRTCDGEGFPFCGDSRS